MLLVYTFNKTDNTLKTLHHFKVHN